MSNNNYYGLMQINNIGVNFAVLAAVITSMMFMVIQGGGIIKAALAQANPMIPAAGQGGSGSSNATSSSMSNMKMSASSSGGSTTNKTTVVRDSQTILLEGKTIPAKDFIHLYDSTPYMIMNGHIAMKIPCDTSSKPAVNVLIGSAPDVKPVEPELIKELSKPGSMCLYHVDVGSDAAKKIIQTDIAIQNPTNKTITFPPTSTFVIGVNEITPGAPG
jgi:hypothetical protein